MTIQKKYVRTNKHTHKLSEWSKDKEMYCSSVCLMCAHFLLYILLSLTASARYLTAISTHSIAFEVESGLTTARNVIFSRLKPIPDQCAANFITQRERIYIYLVCRSIDAMIQSVPKLKRWGVSLKWCMCMRIRAPRSPQMASQTRT